ncbi:MAG: hypothetical protein HF967_07950 [Methanosarcinales archaeon]|jgi:hypothetical protein|nr:hypothetical protein [Methanosarcinales archaeon]
MIVRMMGEGQYELDSECIKEVNKIDNEITDFVENDDAESFKTSFLKMKEYIRANGDKIPDDVIKPSELVIPPCDLTIEEAKKLFKDDGMIPD